MGKAARTAPAAIAGARIEKAAIAGAAPKSSPETAPVAAPVETQIRGGTVVRSAAEIAFPADEALRKYDSEAEYGMPRAYARNVVVRTPAAPVAVEVGGAVAVELGGAEAAGLPSPPKAIAEAGKMTGVAGDGVERPKSGGCFGGVLDRLRSRKMSVSEGGSDKGGSWSVVREVELGREESWERGAKVCGPEYRVAGADGREVGEGSAGGVRAWGERKGKKIAAAANIRTRSVREEVVPRTVEGESDRWIEKAVPLGEVAPEGALAAGTEREDSRARLPSKGKNIAAAQTSPPADCVVRAVEERAGSEAAAQAQRSAGSHSNSGQGEFTDVRTRTLTPEEVRAAGGENSRTLYENVHDEFRKSCVCDPMIKSSEGEAYAAPICEADLRDAQDLRSGDGKGRRGERHDGECVARDGFIASRAGGEAESVPRAAGGSGEITILMDKIEQTITGFGFSHAFWTHWPAQHPNRADIFRLLLTDLRPSIVRLRNVFELEERSGRDMEVDSQFLAEARRQLGQDAPRVMLCAWTPPRRLKQSGRLNGGGQGSVLKKDDNGWFMYSEWAAWWLESYRAYERMGLKPTWLSQQNEPDFSPSTHQACEFGAVESFDVPSYYYAGRALKKLFAEEAGDPKLRFIGPESYGFDRYLNEFPYGGGVVFSGIANHLYLSGETKESNMPGRARYTDPYSFVDEMNRTREMARKKQIADVFMSEWADLGEHMYQDPLRLAITIHNSLTVADCTAYLIWDGFWASGVDNKEGTLLLVDDPGDKSKWANEKGFTVLHSLYWFQHFCKNIRPGFRRVQIAISVPDVLTTAWTGPDGQFVVININTSREYKRVTMLDLPAWIATQTNDVFYSTLDEGYTHAGGFNDNTVSLKPRSITSLLSRK